MTDAATTTERPAISAPAAFGLAVLLGGLVILAGNWDVAKDENGGLEPAISSAVILVVVAAVLYFAVLPRVRNTDRTAIILGALGVVVSVIVFWLGISPLLAAAAVVVGTRSARQSKPAIVLETLAVVLAVASVALTLVETNLY